MNCHLRWSLFFNCFCDIPNKWRKWTAKFHWKLPHCLWLIFRYQSYRKLSKILGTDKMMTIRISHIFIFEGSHYINTRYEKVILDLVLVLYIVTTFDTGSIYYYNLRQVETTDWITLVCTFYTINMKLQRMNLTLFTWNTRIYASLHF